MRKLGLLFLLCAISVYAARNKPKLVLTIVIDQFRYDYLTRFRSDYNAGLSRLLTNGAVFTNAFYQHFPTVTAIGHSTILSGALPSISGIVGNEWLDRNTGKMHTSVEDPTTVLLGGSPGIGASPRRLLVSTVGDELKMADQSASKVIGISLKDRSAILPAGHMADAAYWFDLNTGAMVSSDYYFKQKELPAWATRFNRQDIPGKHLGESWMPLNAKAGAAAYRIVPKERVRTSFETYEQTIWGNELVEQFAEAAIENEKLGQHPVPDLLSVSFSSNDILGHGVGPDDPAVRDIAIGTDRVIGRLLQFVDAKIGRGNALVVLTADHGVAPVPEVMRQRNMPAGRMPISSVVTAINNALSARYGDEKWIQGTPGRAMYLNHDLLKKHKTTPEEAQHVAAEAVRALPHMFRVYTAADLAAGHIQGDLIDMRVRNGYNAAEGADLFIVPEPYWLFSSGTSGTDHGMPFNYDSHVPVIFMGEGIRPGHYDMSITVNDIAPTLATMLAVETPSGSVGRVLTEMLVP